MIAWILTVLSNFPVIETVVLIVLALITVFRKELSSNDAYRNPTNPNQLPSLPNLPAIPSLPRVPSLNSLNQISLDDCKTALASTVEVAKDTIEGAGNQVWANTWDRYVTPVLDVNPADELSDMQEFEVVSKRRALRHGNILHLLSEDILMKLVLYLTNADICSVAFTSKSLSKFMLSDIVWEHIWFETYGAMWQEPAVMEIRELRRILWDPYANWGPPGQGWFLFYLQFEICWMNWLLAGLCTPRKCVVGLHNSLYDVTDFVPLHPGSPEVLMDFSGCDASAVYEDIGHSHHALQLSGNYLIWGDVKYKCTADSATVEPSVSAGRSTPVTSSTPSLSSSPVSMLPVASLHLSFGSAQSTPTTTPTAGSSNVPFSRLNRGRQSGRGRYLRNRTRMEDSDNNNYIDTWIRRKVSTRSMLFKSMQEEHKLWKEIAETTAMRSESSGITSFISSAAASAGSTLGSTLETGMTFGSNIGSTIGSTLGSGLSIGSRMGSSLGSTLSGAIFNRTDSNTSTTMRDEAVEQAVSGAEEDSTDVDDTTRVMSAPFQMPTTLPSLSLPHVIDATVEDVVHDSHTRSSTPTSNISLPADLFFYDSRRLVPHLEGSYSSSACCRSLDLPHSGQVRIMFDPLEQRWVTWWTCCGIGYRED